MAERVTGKSKSKHVKKMERKAHKGRVTAAWDTTKEKHRLADSLSVGDLKAMLKKKSSRSKRSQASE